MFYSSQCHAVGVYAQYNGQTYVSMSGTVGENDSLALFESWKPSC